MVAVMNAVSCGEGMQVIVVELLENMLVLLLSGVLQSESKRQYLSGMMFSVFSARRSTPHGANCSVFDEAEEEESNDVTVTKTAEHKAAHR